MFIGIHRTIPVVLASIVRTLLIGLFIFVSRSPLTGSPGITVQSGSSSPQPYQNSSNNPPTTSIESVQIIHVPADVSNLQDAIKQVPDGGIIELATGTYENSGKSYSISNTQKGFTIRAASGAAVTLTGNNKHDILRYNNSSLEKGKMVHFIGLTFASGYTTTDGVAAGITMRYAKATFFNCVFKDNFGNQATTGGGAIIVGDQSLAYFTNTNFLNNRAKFYGAGMDIASNSQVSLNSTQSIRFGWRDSCIRFKTGYFQLTF